jgi:hypothetical protein
MKNDSPGPDLEEMRAVPADRIVSSIGKFFEKAMPKAQGLFLTPTLDGKVLDGGYYELMDKTRRAMMRIPLLGKPVAGAIIRLKTWLKRMMVAQSNLFEMYGIRYFGPGDGNDLKTVERLFRAAKRHQGPCIVHLYTVKGKGYEPAENDPSKFHSVGASKKKPAPKKPTPAPMAHVKKEGPTATVHLRLINANFAAGETVDLEALKAKGLVPANAVKLRVTAVVGEEFKAITVVANHISVQAAKTITLAGGKAIIKE